MYGFTMRIPDRQKQVLDKECSRLGISRAELIRRILDDWVLKIKEEEKNDN